MKKDMIKQAKAIEEAMAHLEEVSKCARGVIWTDHPLAREWSKAYDTWICARWDAGDQWVRSVWKMRP
jgi:hypothetical protein